MVTERVSEFCSMSSDRAQLPRAEGVAADHHNQYPHVGWDNVLVVPRAWKENFRGIWLQPSCIQAFTSYVHFPESMSDTSRSNSIPSAYKQISINPGGPSFNRTGI